MDNFPQDYDRLIEEMYHPENFSDEFLSICCGVPVDEDLLICPNCGEHCGVEHDN